MTIRPLQANDQKYLNLPFPRLSGWVICAPTPIGYANWYTINGLPHLVDIELWIQPSMRRRSYGQKLLNFLVSELSKTPHTEMSITGIINKPFFETNGFVVGHEEITLTRQLGSEQGDANALSILAPSKLIHLYNEAFHPHPWYQPFENAGDVADHLGASGFIMKGKDGGFAGIIPTKTSIVIEPFGVAPEAQGKGVGKRFLHDLLTWLADNGYKTAKLTIWKANQPAWNLYTKAGFEPVSTNQFWKRTINP